MTKLVLKKTTTALVCGEPESEKSPLSSSEEARLKLLETIWRFLVLQDKRKRYKQFLNAPKEPLSKAHIFELISLATKIFKEETTLIETLFRKWTLETQISVESKACYVPVVSGMEIV
uniref:Uncharacterized protein n=1 Tax=Romanomermis culicivorax TaxID=13658 RepID=A0A915HZV7_ROMCU